jgi:hypothetical protein
VRYRERYGAAGFHHDRLDPALCEPISKPVQIASERSERKRCPGSETGGCNSLDLSRSPEALSGAKAAPFPDMASGIQGCEQWKSPDQAAEDDRAVAKREPETP